MDGNKTEQVLYKLFEGYNYSFFQTVHVSADVEVDVAVGFNCELVFFHNFVRDKCVVHA